jgi:hypothetical protein
MKERRYFTNATNYFVFKSVLSFVRMRNLVNYFGHKTRQINGIHLLKYNQNLGKSPQI